MAEITIELKKEEIDKLVADLNKKSEDLSSAMSNIAAVMRDGVIENFLQQGRPTPWKPLAEVTTKAKVGGRFRGSDNILRVTNTLFSSIQEFSSAREASVGTNSIYGAIHHFGGRAGRGRKVEIPARPFMQISKEEEAEIADILLEEIARR